MWETKILEQMITHLWRFYCLKLFVLKHYIGMKIASLLAIQCYSIMIHFGGDLENVGDV